MKNLVLFCALMFCGSAAFANDADFVLKCYNKLTIGLDQDHAASLCSHVKSDSDIKAVNECYNRLTGCADGSSCVDEKHATILCSNVKGN